MVTSCNISTISYNSREFLLKTLSRLVELRVINFYSFIEHLPEEDEKKSHIHLYIVPNGRIDTDKLREDYFLEPVSSSTSCLNCLPFYHSKWADWYLYSSHNRSYLNSKMEERKYYYSDDEFVNSDDMYFTELCHTIDYSKFMGNERFKNAVLSGMTFKECLEKGIVPINLVRQYQTFYGFLKGFLSEPETPSGVSKGETLSVPKNAEA